MNLIRARRIATVTLATGLFLVLDALRIWLPSFTTIFGSAGSTPAVELALFCLAWVVPLVLVVPLARRLPWLPLLLAAILVAAEAALRGGASGAAQLYASSIAASAGMGWLIAVATRGWPARALAPGLTLALALTTWLALATTTLDLTWMPAWLGWPLLVLAGALLLAGTAALHAVPGAGGAAPWLGALPALILAGLITIAIGRGWADVTWPPPWWGGALVGAAAMLALVPAARGGLLRRGWTVALLLVGAVALADLARRGHALPAWSALPQALVAFLLPVALAQAAATADRSPMRRGAAASAGVLAGVILLATYYVAFDASVPLPRPLFVLSLALLPAAVAVAGGRAQLAPVPRGLPAAAGALALMVAATAFLARPLPPLPPVTPAAEPLTVMTYNIRYGISADGRFNPEALASVIEQADPDILLLQEVERGFLLNGSHDVLALLQRRLRRHAYYNPASEPLFGDAILSRWPLARVEAVALPRRDVPTRPGVIGAVLTLADGRELAVATTHLHENEAGISAEQVTDLAAHVRRWSADGTRPLLLSGDFNVEPDDPRLAPLLAFLHDGLAGARPLLTSRSDRPTQQIDHMFVTDKVQLDEVRTIATTASDHLPVVARVHLE